MSFRLKMSPNRVMIMTRLVKSLSLLEKFPLDWLLLGSLCSMLWFVTAVEMIAASDNFEQTYFFIKHELPDFQIIYYEGKGPNMIQFLLQAQCLQNSSSHISLYKLHVLNKTLRTWDVITGKKVWGMVPGELYCSFDVQPQYLHHQHLLISCDISEIIFHSQLSLLKVASADFDLWSGVKCVLEIGLEFPNYS